MLICCKNNYKISSIIVDSFSYSSFLYTKYEIGVIKSDILIKIKGIKSVI